MALDFIQIKDFAGQAVKVFTDAVAGIHTQVLKLSYGAEDSAPVLISDTAPLPVSSRPQITGTQTTTVALVGGTPKKVADANPNRDGLSISVPSDSGAVVWFSFDNAPAIGKGNETLAGGPFTLGRRGVLYTQGEVWAISATAVNLGVIEVSSV